MTKDGTISEKKKPNILIFFCDQLRTDILGCYGSKIVRTPNINALANSSTIFDNAYTPTGICSPARASLLTGLYPHSHNMYTNTGCGRGNNFCEKLRPEMTMIQDWTASETEYESAYFGKTHFGPIRDFYNGSFDHTHEAYVKGDPLFESNTHWHPTTSLSHLVKTVKGSNGKSGTLDMPMDKFPDVMVARFTQDFLRQRNEEKPFLAFCAFPGPHSPWLIPEEFGLRYDPKDIPLWKNRHDDFKNKPLNQKKLRLIEGNVKNKVGTACEQNDEMLPELLAYMFSYMELIDTMVGEVVATLKAQGLYDDTVIIFTADHGDMAGSHGFISKGSYMYDEVYRIPLIIKQAGKTEHKRIKDEPVHLMDVTATCMHLMTGCEHTAMGAHTLHGQSLMPFIKREKNWDRKVHYAEYHGDWYGHYSTRMVTDGKWKLVWNLSDLCELYDLKNDPDELDNRFFDPACRAICDHYFALMKEEAERLEDDILENFYDPGIEYEMINELKKGIVV